MRTGHTIAPMVIGIGIALLAVGGLLALLTVIVFQRTRRFLSTAVRAEGEVIGLEQRAGASSEGGPRIAYHPQVRFTGDDGEEHEFTDKVGSKPPAYKEGENVEVLHPPGDPGRAMLDSWAGRNLGWVIAAAFAAGFLGFGALMVFAIGDRAAN